MARDGHIECKCRHARREHFQYGPCRSCDCAGFARKPSEAFVAAKRIDWDRFMIAMKPGGRF